MVLPACDLFWVQPRRISLITSVPLDERGSNDWKKKAKGDYEDVQNYEVEYTADRVAKVGTCHEVH